LRVSVRTGQGIDALLAAIFSHLAERSSEAGLLSHHRQVEMVREAHGLAQKCRQRLGLDDMETLAEDLRQAGRERGKLA